MAKKYLDKTGLNYFFGKIKALIPKKDNTTITENSNGQLQTVGVIDQKTSNTNKFWTGTLAEYNAITTKDPNTFYTITDDYVEVPTKTSELTNDSGFVTSSGTVSTATTANKTKGTLTIQSNGTTVKTFNGSSSVTANITIPTKFSDLVDDSPYELTEAIYEEQYPIGAIYITTSSGFNPSTIFEGQWELVKTYSGGELIAFGTATTGSSSKVFANNVTFAFADLENIAYNVTNYVDGIVTGTANALLINPQGLVGMIDVEMTVTGIGGNGITGLWWKGNYNTLPTGVTMLPDNGFNSLTSGPYGVAYGGGSHSFQYKIDGDITNSFFINPTVTPYGGTFHPSSGGVRSTLQIKCYAKAGATYVWKRVGA